MSALTVSSRFVANSCGGLESANSGRSCHGAIIPAGHLFDGCVKVEVLQLGGQFSRSSSSRNFEANQSTGKHNINHSLGSSQIQANIISYCSNSPHFTGTRPPSRNCYNVVSQ